MPKPEEAVTVCNALQVIERTAREIRQILENIDWDFPFPDCIFGPWVADQDCRPGFPQDEVRAKLVNLREGVELITPLIETVPPH